MKIFGYPQLSEEWWQLKVGKISGTRFGQAISSRKNRLVYDLMNEILTGQCSMDDFCSDEMQYGVDNESEALRLYTEQTGIKTAQIGAILSDENEIHMASPDGISIRKGLDTVVQEVKCTPNGEIHIERIFEGVDTKYLPQCINYFAVSDEIKEVHFISYCGYRKERPIHVIKLKREDFETEITKGLIAVNRIKNELNEKLEKYKF